MVAKTDNNNLRLAFFPFLQKLILKDKKNSYDYVVLTTRRCFCLFSAFKKDKSFINEHKTWFRRNKNQIIIFQDKVISSQAIDLVGKNFEGKNVLLVDDVMIHGKTVYSFYEQIKNYGANNIDTSVLVRQIEHPDYYFFKTKKLYDYSYEEERIDWRRLSNNIVTYLHALNQLYASYEYGFYVSDDLFSKKDNSSLKKCPVQFKNYISHKTYEESFEPTYYIYNGFSDYKFVRDAYLRVYKDKINGYQVVPYIELMPMSNETISKIWDSIWISESVPDELLYVLDCKDQYKSLIVALSLIMYSNIFNSSYNVTHEIDKSYIKDFTTIISASLRSDFLDVINKKYVPVNKQYQMDFGENCSIMENELSSLICDNNEYNGPELLKCYFYTVTNKEEEYFNKMIKEGIIEGYLKEDKIDSNRTMAISLELFYEKINITKFENKVALLYLLDNGVASCLIEERNGCVEPVLKVGEQSYHLFADLTGKAFRAVYMLLKFVEEFKNNEKKCFIKKFIEYLKQSPYESLIENFESLVWVLNHPPVDLDSDYFGILEKREEELLEETKDEEDKIIDSFIHIINEI